MLIVKIMDFVGKSLLAALLIVVGVAGVVGIALLVVNGWAEYSIPISLLVVAVAIVGAGERIASAIRARAGASR